jgi:phosphohistidine phosphatase
VDHTLVLLRHASAEPLAPSDAERALTPQGHAEARAAGAWLAGRPTVPDRALVSDARRARETWAGVADAAGWTLEPEYDAGLYSADTDSALDLVRLTDEGVRTLLLVGHNPTVASLVQVLDDGDGTEGTEVLRRGFPAGSAAVFEFACRWDELELSCARLVAFRPGEPG